MDTSAIEHLTPQKDWFSTYKPLNPSLSIFMGDYGSQETIGLGTIPIHLHIGHITKIPNVLHVLHLPKNLMFVCKATRRGSNIEFFDDHCMVKTTTKGQKVVFRRNQVGSLYPIGEGVFPTQVNSIVGHNNGVHSQNKELGMHL